MSIFHTIRKYLLYLSKILYVSASIYYLCNSNSYSVSFYIPEFVRESKFFSAPFTFIENTGMLITILPLSIVLISFIYTESKFITILSAFISVSGNIFSLAISISKGILQDYFRAGFLVIYHEVSLEKKTKLFDLHFYEYIKLQYYEKVKSISEFTDFIDMYVVKHRFNCIENLKSLSLDRTRGYAEKIAQDAYTSYLDFIMFNVTKDTHIRKSTFMDSISSNKVVIILGAGVVFIAAAFLFYKAFHFIQKNAEETRNTITRVQNFGIVQGTSNANVSGNAANIATMADENITNAVNLKSILNEFSDRLLKYCEKTTKIEGSIGVIDDRLLSLERKAVSLLMPSDKSLNKEQIAGVISVMDDIQAIIRNNVKPKLETLSAEDLKLFNEIELMKGRLTTLEQQQQNISNVNSMIPRDEQAAQLASTATTRQINTLQQQVNDLKIDNIKQETKQYVTELVTKESNIIKTNTAETCEQALKKAEITVSKTAKVTVKRETDIVLESYNIKTERNTTEIKLVKEDVKTFKEEFMDFKNFVKESLSEMKKNAEAFSKYVLETLAKQKPSIPDSESVIRNTLSESAPAAKTAMVAITQNKPGNYGLFTGMSTLLKQIKETEPK